MCTPQKLRGYRESQKDYWDLYAVTETAEHKGEKRGYDEAMAKVARAMKNSGYPLAEISKMTGLPEEIIQSL